MTRPCGHRCVICDGAAYLSDDFRKWAWLMGRIADMEDAIKWRDLSGLPSGNLRNYLARLNDERKAAWEALR